MNQKDNEWKPYKVEQEKTTSTKLQTIDNDENRRQYSAISFTD